MHPSSGTATFLFTDIEGSTWLVQELGEKWDSVLYEHHRLLREVWVSHSGQEVSTEGDAFFVVFGEADDAVAAAVAAQRALLALAMPAGLQLRVRIGMHTGTARRYGDDYVGLSVHQAARVSAAAHGEQILISEDTRRALNDTRHEGSCVDLGLHRLKDIGEPVRLFQFIAPGLRVDFPPPRTLTAVPNNFPLRTTSFVGREDEVAALRKTLEEGRLVTLTGAGGVGKTRLGIEVCNEMLDHFQHGAWLVDLASVSDPLLVATATASALGVREQPPRPLTDTLVDYLLPRCTLLLLDNCEHLIDACAEFTDHLLVHCPQVKILATSREALNVPGEICWRLRSLTVPPAQAQTGEIADAESVRLFEQRTRQVRPDFLVTPDNALAVAQICRRLDGVPLALELAAARARTMEVEEIASRLDDRFRLLTGGARTSLPRQRTLEATVAWSYDLLGQTERHLLARLSVFAGGFTLVSAREVCAVGTTDPEDALEHVTLLAERSMIHMGTSTTGQTRYGMLETIRQFARERLVELADSGVIHDRFLRWAVRLAETAVTDSPTQPAALTAEEDNLRAALAWAVDTGQHEAALRIAGSVWFGDFDERIRLYAQILPPAPSVPPEVAAKACFAGLGLAFMTGDWGRGVELAKSGTAAARAAGDQVRLAMCLIYGGLCEWGLGDLARGLELAAQGLAEAEQSGYAEGQARALMSLAWMWSDTDLDRAEAAAVRGLERANSLGAFEVGHLKEALAFIHCLREDYQRASDLLAETAVVFKSVQPNCGAHILETCAAWAAMTDRFELGLEILASAERLREETGDKPRPWEAHVRNDWLPRLSAALDPKAATVIRARGRERGLMEALDFAAGSLQAGRPRSGGSLTT
jgi:predicted ATPase/class 3 adenylate cyclase